MRGSVVHIHVYDLGGEVDLTRVGDLLNAHPTFEPLEIRKTSPKYVEFARTLTIRFPPETRETTAGPLTLDVLARVYDIGAVSFVVRSPFECSDLGGLVTLGTARLLEKDGEEPMEGFTRPLFQAVRQGLSAALVEPYPVTVEPERYTIYALTDLGEKTVNDLLATDRQALAGALAGEPQASRLSPEEVEDNLRTWYRYYEDDLVVVDWDYAVVVEPSGKYEDVLYVCELANLELLELRTYDRYLDDVLDKAHGHLNRFYGRGGLFRSARDVMRDLSEARIDLIHVTDEINNLGKIYGDWFLAKLHMGLADRFHLAEWEKTVTEKMQALSELYTLAAHEVEHRRGILLEGMIVLLFIVDLALILLLKG